MNRSVAQGRAINVWRKRSISTVSTGTFACRGRPARGHLFATRGQTRHFDTPTTCTLSSAAAGNSERSADERRVLVVWHSRTGLARQMAVEMERGALDVARQLEGEANIRIVRLPARQVSCDDVLAADGFLFCAPENLAALSGEMKEFFDRCYYEAFTASNSGDMTASGADYTETSMLLGCPVGIAIAAGSDGTNAARQIERICQGWRLRPVAETFIHRNGLPQTKASILSRKSCPQDVRQRCHEIGGLVAATVLL